MTEADLAGFVGADPFAPPLPRRPDHFAVLPAPARIDLTGAVTVTSDAVTIHGAPPGARAVLTSGLARVGVRVVDGGGWPITFAADPSIDGDEAYAIDAHTDGLRVTAATAVGLVRGAATARQLVRPQAAGLVVQRCTVADRPTIPRRLLAGWGLYRTHHLDWALEVAIEGKFNRVLYNWWTAAPDDRLGPDEERLVETARTFGIELVCELRRQALGPGFSLRDEAAVEGLLTHYDDAVDRGFRSFGFLFDDTDHDEFDDELGLLQAIVQRLTRRLGAEPEFFFCPRFYWFPGQMDYSWMQAATAAEDDGPSMAPMLGGAAVRSVEEAAARQEDYQRRLAGALPDRTEVYLANWWSGTPAGWERQLDAGWTARVGRAPVFWDNQQQNDFRAAVVLPMPVHQRPAAFASALRGYCLNSGVPVSAYAPGSITAGAWAWNPAGYDPGLAYGVALERLFGAAAPRVTDALATWSTLLDELLAPRTGTEQHYRGLLLAVRAGRSAELSDRLDDVAGLLTQARAELAASAHPLAADALTELEREVIRLRLDLALAGCTDRPEGEALVEQIGAILASRLPPEPAVSWALHFLHGPLRAGPHRLLAKIPPVSRK